MPSGQVPLPVPIVPAPVSVWTNPVNSFDVNDEGRVTPLDALETINFINTRPGETSLPVRQFSPPRFFDTSVDGAVTPTDVLLVVNYLNTSAESAGEGETNDLIGAILAITDLWPELLSLDMPLGSSSAVVQRNQVGGTQDTAVVPAAPWTSPAFAAKSPPAPSSAPWLGDLDRLDLESVMADIAPEIAAGSFGG